MIVATAGHIDHGKTSLVRAITGVDTDRLPEEKARGISIDLGFAYWAAPGGPTVGFVDVPGHERFIRNMLAGVCAVDFVMLVVAADDGVMPQTLEHLRIVDLLGVAEGVVAITKIDRVDTARVQEVSADVRALLGGTRLAHIDVLPVSARSGAGMPGLCEHLTRAAKTRIQNRCTDSHSRLIVDRAFTVPGTGTVVTGIVVASSIRTGDRLLVSPSGVQVRVRGIQQQGKQVDVAQAGERCALSLAGVDQHGIRRGDWIVAPALHAPTDRLDVRLSLLAGEPQPLKHWTPLHLHLGAADVPARVAMRRGAAIMPGESALVQLRLERPVASLHGDRFVIRDQSATRTIGGGTVVDPFSSGSGKSRSEYAGLLASLEHADAASAITALLTTSAAGVDIDWAGRIFNRLPSSIEALLRASGARLVGKDPRIGIAPTAIARLQQLVRLAVQRFHADSPQAWGLEIDSLHRQVAPRMQAGLFGLLLRGAAAQDQVLIEGTRLRLATHDATANPRDQRTWQIVKPQLELAGSHVPSVRELSVACGIAEALLRDFLHRKNARDELVRITPERFTTPEVIDRLIEATRQTEATSDAPFTAAQYRDRIGTGRGLAIEILECLDRRGVTTRDGEGRRIVGKERKLNDE